MENINFTVQENCHAADPMFHKMSQAFDEGGAKGMLMSNLVKISVYHFINILLFIDFIFIIYFTEGFPQVVNYHVQCTRSRLIGQG